MVEQLSLRSVLEAALFASGEVLTVDKLQEALSQSGWKVSRKEVRSALEQLQKEYSSGERGMQIEKVAGGYRMVSRPEAAPILHWLVRERRRQRLSQAAVETLAIIAYRQPITRGEIESIRGVGAGNIVRNLVELGLVEVVGRSSEKRGAYLYGTTQRFLEVFGLESLDDLPGRQNSEGSAKVS